jgi:hypothetical protein
MKPTSMRWTGNVACMVEIRNEYVVFVWKPDRRDLLGYLGVVWRIILKYILKK